MKGCGKWYLNCDILPKYTCIGAMPGLQAERTGDFGKEWTMKVFNDSMSYLTR